MPIYEFECPAHGTFELSRSMAESGQPEHCPKCQRLAPRIVSLIAARAAPRALVRARDRNEQSAEQPRFAERQASAPVGAAKRRPLKIASQGRPWVIEHG